MKFVIDENLPPRLAAWLRERGYDAKHVRDCLELAASDKSLAQFAIAEDRTIVTKDTDFETPLAGERVLRLGVGNCTTGELLDWLEPRLAGALERFDRSETYVELV